MTLIAHAPSAESPSAPAFDVGGSARVEAARVPSLCARHIGVLCADPALPEAIALQRAAATIGARVALVRFDLAQASGQAGPDHIARVLGQLYDAVLCLALPPALVEQLRAAAAIPVLSDADDEAPAPAGSLGEQLLARLASLDA